MQSRMVVALTAVSLAMWGQQAMKPLPVPTSTPGVAAPIPIHRVEPVYPEKARRDRIQGSVLLRLVVDQTGVPTRIQVLLPRGYGFDESAVESVSQWRFTPGMKDGKPIAVNADVEVAFALPALRSQKEYQKEQEQRAEYTSALNDLMGNDRARQRKALERIVKLSKLKFAPAMMVEGTYLISGELGARDPAKGRALLAKSAELGFAPALYLQGGMMVEGAGVEKDVTGGLKLITEAADCGNVEAQHYIADAYASGRFGEKKPDEAFRYFRLCAVPGREICQYELAKVLLTKPDDDGNNLVWAAAWLRTASAGGHSEAQKLLLGLNTRLSSEEKRRVDSLNLPARLTGMKATGMVMNPKRR